MIDIYFLLSFFISINMTKSLTVKKIMKTERERTKREKRIQ